MHTIAQQVARLTGTLKPSGKYLARQLYARGHAANELYRQLASADGLKDTNSYRYCCSMMGVLIFAGNSCHEPQEL
jgi:hypothetical protein